MNFMKVTILSYCTFYSLYIHLISLVTSCFADRCIRHKDADSQTLLFCQQLESIRKENVANVVHSNTVHACKYVYHLLLILKYIY